MRFIYGFIFGVLASTIGAILYLAFGGGEYLLQISPRFHDMAATITSLKDAKEQRDLLANRLDALAEGFDQLTQRFNELTQTVRETPHHGPAEPLPPPTPAPEPIRPKTRTESPRVEPPHVEPPAVAPTAP
jgi:hypothetical protein